MERTLHDGTQNRLVALVMHLGMLERALADAPESTRRLTERAQEAASDALANLRDAIRAIHPPVLTEHGLDGALVALAARSPVPCTVEIADFPRLPAAVEAAAYFTAAEALTNVAKHSHAEKAVALAHRGQRAGELTALHQVVQRGPHAAPLVPCGDVRGGRAEGSQREGQNHRGARPGGSGENDGMMGHGETPLTT
ncbi:sensor histidine kinase [Streptosporangium sp. NPDC001559]|uniref:sensor histidine kinase n=1 Tax=Streptosporangium sp. NPDC001559 TaxID=3366187 RepID=UPI0036F0A540